MSQAQDKDLIFFARAGVLKVVAVAGCYSPATFIREIASHINRRFHLSFQCFTGRFKLNMVAGTVCSENTVAEMEQKY